MRILIVDDEPAMHDSYRRSFAPAGTADTDALDAMAAELFGDGETAPAPSRPGSDLVLTHAMQGLDAVGLISPASTARKPPPESARSIPISIS
jgi:hypothetical protein